MNTDKINNTVVAIIPVRGGSIGIPRKNARIIGGKPLVAYCIENALRAKDIHTVYVSTVDPELAEISKRYGAKVLIRPAALAEAQSTLDEVIVEAVRQLEGLGENFAYIVTLQATSPLLKPSSIERAICKCREEKLDTVLSVVDDRHLSWSVDETNELVPQYEKRLNRQQLPPVYRETGGVVVATKDVIKTGSRFGNKVGVVEVGRAESIDIDTYFDWWLVEKSLSRRRICFHVIGDQTSGLGHVYRALTLADRLIDHDISFLVNSEAELAARLIQQRFYPLKIVESGMEATVLRDEAPDLVVNDVLDTTSGFMDDLLRSGLKTVNFEDLGGGSVKADSLINAMYDFHPKRTDANVYHGIKYDCLRDEFYSIAPKKMLGEVMNVLLIFGGTDPNDLTLRSLQWLDEVDGKWKINVILGLGYGKERSEIIAQYAKQARHQVEIIRDTTIVSRFMSEADVAITSAGRTVFELASLAVPMIAMGQNDREDHHVFVRNSPGVIYLGQAMQVGKKQFTDAVGQIVASCLLRRNMRESLLATDIRHGISRVLEIITKTLNGESDEAC